MSETLTLNQSMTVDLAIKILQQLSPRERLKVISVVLPETEQELPGQETEPNPPPRESLYGLWKDLGFDVTSEDIDAVRKEVWKNFPREDIV